MDQPIYDYPKYLRADSITGIGNPLAFFEWLLNHSKDKPIIPFTLISLDVINLKKLNESHGLPAGDAALRWIALVLLEEAQAKVYRISGDEFVGVLTQGSIQDHTKLCERVHARLIAEAKQVNLEPPAASLAIIHFSGLEELSPEDVLGVIYATLLDIKSNPRESFKVFDAATTTPLIKITGLVNDMVKRMVSLGAMLDKSHRLAYHDSITGLPNMHVVDSEIKKTIRLHKIKDKSFAVLLIDGDDLSKYNKIGYLAGDKMIERLGTVLKNQLRHSDFLARWRTGDEFLVLLQDTTIEQAISTANQLRISVIEASQDWTYPITISIGVAGYPNHGKTGEELTHQAEVALIQAKNSGKNRCHFPLASFQRPKAD
ncbi:MAG: diguanylate cyclase [Anaerolineales bacterium]|jgi:diguanylate cyclase (GGDEF)-like protein